MKRYLVLILSILALVMACSNPLNRTTAEPQAPVLNKISPLASDAELMANEWVNYGYIIAKADQSTDPAVFARLGLAVKGKIELDNGAVYYRLYRENKIAKALHDLRGVTGVEYAQAELKSKLIEPKRGLQNQSDVQYRGLTGGNLESDPKSNMNDYALAITQALNSYNTASNGYGANTVYVAVIDTGINMTHEDFKDSNGNLIVEYAKSAFNKSGSTFTWVGDGENFVTIPLGQNWDDEAHGSHVSGTIAAIGDNNKGVAGVAWKNVKLISYKCFANSEQGSGSDWSIYGALADLADWVNANRSSGVSHGQTIVPVNMSLGGEAAGDFELEMINYAIEKGVLPIVAMGYDGQRVTKYPAAYQGVIAVGATNGRDEKVGFSNTGSWISVSAPGFNIYSCGNGGDNWTNPAYSVNDYQWMSGTSMATPFVTGVVAYLLSFNKTLTASQIKKVLETTADDKGTPGFDESFGYGRVNVENAATLVRTGSWNGNNLADMGNAYVYNWRIEATVTNKESAFPFVPVYLHKQDGSFVALGVTNKEGKVYFYGLLPKANYELRANLGDTKAVAPVNFTSPNAHATASLTFDVNVYWICTVPNTYYNGGNDPTDTVIEIFRDSALTDPVYPKYDQGTFDSIAYKLNPGTYYVRITYYVYKQYQFKGNYGIKIGTGFIDTLNQADGTRTASADDSHEQDDTGAQADAKGLFTLNTPFAANLLDADVFKIQIQ